MIVSDHFVYIHTSRSAGTFLNRLILQHVPGAQMLQYHGHLKDLPEQYSQLPVIGFVRNPWDWYVSMYFDYRRKQQYVYQIISERGTLDFKSTVERFLRLGESSPEIERLRDQLVKLAPRTINARNPARRGLPGLRSEHFQSYTEDQGYYSWLFRLMYETETKHAIHIGRFEAVREEALRLFELTGVPITNAIATYLSKGRALNPSPRPPSYIVGYSPELEQLVAEKDSYLVERFDYKCSEIDK